MLSLVTDSLDSKLAQVQAITDPVNSSDYLRVVEEVPQLVVGLLPDVHPLVVQLAAHHLHLLQLAPHCYKKALLQTINYINCMLLSLIHISFKSKVLFKCLFSRSDRQLLLAVFCRINF